jgi:Fic family protein
MEEFISKANRLQTILHALQPMQEEDQRRVEKKFRMEFNYNSNHLEGSTLSYSETELLLIFDLTRAGTDRTFREYEEMKGHDVAYKLVQEWAADKERPLTEAFIKYLNKLILVRPFWKPAMTRDRQPTRKHIQVGEYKQTPNSVDIGNGETFEYTSPQETPIQMGELLQWYLSEEAKAELHPVELAALLHYKYIRIHPFDDGNGRIARLLMNYVSFRHGLPPIVVKSADKRSYLAALQTADAGNIDAFIEFVIQQSIWSLEISIKAAKGESINEMGDLHKKIDLLKKRLGNGPDEDIKLKKSALSTADIFLYVVKPLAEEWERRLREFDGFFMDRSNSIKVDGRAEEGPDMGKLAQRVWERKFAGNINPNLMPSSVELNAAPKGIRRGAREVGINGGQVQLHFMENTYEILYNQGIASIHKLYHQRLSDQEIKEIAEVLGTQLLEILEKELSGTVRYGQ